MELEIKLYAMLRQYRPTSADGALHHPFSMTVPTPLTVAELATYLGIPDGFVNATAVNGEATNLDSLLQDGDSVSLFPPAAGG